MRKAKNAMSHYKRTSDWQILIGVLSLASSSAELFTQHEDTALPSNRYVDYAHFLLTTHKFTQLVGSVMAEKGYKVLTQEGITNALLVMSHYINSCIEVCALNPYIPVEKYAMDVYSDLRSAEMIVKVIVDKLEDVRLINFSKYWVSSIRTIIASFDRDIYL